MNRILEQAKNNHDVFEYAQTRLEEHSFSFEAFPACVSREQRVLNEYVKLEKMLAGEGQIKELRKFDEVWREYAKTREEIAYVIGSFDSQQVRERLTKKPTE